MVFATTNVTYKIGGQLFQAPLSPNADAQKVNNTDVYTLAYFDQTDAEAVTTSLTNIATITISGVAYVNKVAANPSTNAAANAVKGFIVINTQGLSLFYPASATPSAPVDIVTQTNLIDLGEHTFMQLQSGDTIQVWAIATATGSTLQVGASGKRIAN